MESRQLEISEQSQTCNYVHTDICLYIYFHYGKRILKTHCTVVQCILPTHAQRYFWNLAHQRKVLSPIFSDQFSFSPRTCISSTLQYQHLTCTTLCIFRGSGRGLTFKNTVCEWWKPGNSITLAFIHIYIYISATASVHQGKINSLKFQLMPLTCSAHLCVQDLDRPVTKSDGPFQLLGSG